MFFLNKFILITFLILFKSNFVFAGDVKGNVKYEGGIPKMKPIKMAADPICDGQHAGGPARSEWLLAKDDGSLRNVFVYVEDGLNGKKFDIPSEPVVLDQIGCIYVPHVIGVQAGQNIEILNSDGTLHNVHSMPKNKNNTAFNEAMPGARKKITKKFDDEEVMVRMKCDVHPWMGAYIGVMNHPYFAVTDENGNFTIKNLPAGEYTLKAWHERLPAKTATIKVGEDGETSVNFVMKRPPKKE